MAKIMAPIVVSGVRMVRDAIDGVSFEFEEGKVSADYIAGFMQCREIILHVLDEMMNTKGEVVTLGEE